MDVPRCCDSRRYPEETWLPPTADEFVSAEKHAYGYATRPPPYGGPAVSVPALAESLVRRGHEVTVFTTNSNFDRLLDVEPNRPHEIEGVQVWYFEKTEPLKIVPGITYLAKSMGVLYSRRMAAALQSVVP